MTGVSIVGRFGEGHPHDPDDFRRCQLLLESVPEFADRLIDVMRWASDEWRALVYRWCDIMDSLESEIPNWRTGRGTAPKTYDLMRSIIEKSREDDE